MNEANPPTTRHSPYEVYEASDVRDLIAAHPLAWVCARGTTDASLLPLVGVYGPGGELVELIGHFARSNPLHSALRTDPRASILFSGPNGYVSPNHAGRRNWGPTWNYSQVRVQAEISVEPDLTAAAVDLLVDHVERDMPVPWTARELGERYGQLMPHIIGFRARVVELSAVFKLGQTEDVPTLRSILSTLQDRELTGWMRRLNPHHPGAKDPDHET